MSRTRINALTAGGALALATAANQVYLDLLRSTEDEVDHESRQLLFPPRP